MLIALERPMARKRKDEDTTHARINPDLHDMIRWIVRVEGGTIPQLIDRMIRQQVRAKYEQHRGAIDIMKAAEKRRLEEESRMDEPPVTPKKRGK